MQAMTAEIQKLTHQRKHKYQNEDGDPLPEQQIAGTEQTAEAVLMDELEKEVQQQDAATASL